MEGLFYLRSTQRISPAHGEQMQPDIALAIVARIYYIIETHCHNCKEHIQTSCSVARKCFVPCQRSCPCESLYFLAVSTFVARVAFHFSTKTSLVKPLDCRTVVLGSRTKSDPSTTMLDIPEATVLRSWKTLEVIQTGTYCILLQSKKLRSSRHSGSNRS